MQKFFIIACTLLASLLNASVQEKQINQQLLENAVLAYMRHFDIPGVAVGVFDGTKETILCYGEADIKTGRHVKPDTIFELASVTKVFTATALGLHLVKGDMSLNDPISKYFPGLKRDRPIDSVTLMQLATHTSSLPRVVPHSNWHNLDLPKIIHFLNHWNPKNPPGTNYEYSNVAFGLIGYAVSEVERRPYSEMIAGDVLIPLHMTSTFTEVPAALRHNLTTGYQENGKEAPIRPPKYIPGSGVLRSTIKDMMKFLKANMGYDVPQGLYKAMKVTHKPYYKVRKNFTMGLGWQRFNHDNLLIIDKNGGLPGTSTYIGFAPEKKLGIVILANKTKARSTEVGRYLLNHLVEYRSI